MDYVFAVLTALLTFISPCVLPLLPVYVSYFTAGEANRWKTFLNSVAFCAGLSIFFILVFSTAALASESFSMFVLNNKTSIFVICGMILVLFGLKIMGYLNLPFLDRTINIKTKTNKVSLLNAFILGLAFSLSMGMCAFSYASFNLINTILVSSFIKSLLIGLIFTLTLDILFIVCAMLIDQLKGMFSFIKRHYKVINMISGGLLVVLGVLIALGFTDKIQVWFSTVVLALTGI